jgi:hypothetical protein
MASSILRMSSGGTWPMASITSAAVKATNQQQTAAFGLSRPVRAALGLPGQWHLETRGRVGRSGDSHTDETLALGDCFIGSDNDDGPELLLAVACDPDADDLTIE